MQRSNLRPTSGVQSARAAASSAAPPLSQAAAAAKERALRQDPTLARSFRGHHGAVLSTAYSPVLIRAHDTNLPGYVKEGASEATWEVGGTVSSRARAQKQASSFVQQLASGGSDHVVMLWHLRPQLRAFRFLGHSGPVNSVAFSADGSLLASASDDTTVRVWTPTAEGKSIVLRGHMKRVRSVAWASDKQWLLSTSDDQQCKLWDVNAGVAHSHFHGHTQAVSTCAFSPDMRLVATGSADRTVKLFDLHTQSCLQTFHQNSAEITVVKFHPFGNVLATGSADNSIKLWDIRNNQLLQHYSAHDLAVSCIDFHPTGNYLLSSSLDSSIRLWDLRQGHQLYTIHGHPSPVNSCAFNSDGTSFVTGGNDQRVITWNSYLDNESSKKNRGPDSLTFGLPKVGLAAAAAAAAAGAENERKRGALLASEVSKPIRGGNTGALGITSVQPGRRDAYYAAEGLTSGPEFIVPEPSGPLPPTDLDAYPGANSSNKDRRAPPKYVFQTGDKKGMVIGPGSLFVADPNLRKPSAPEEEDDSNINTASTAYDCDYRHTHISATNGQVHSFANRHNHEFIETAQAERAAREEAARIAAAEAKIIEDAKKAARGEQARAAGTAPAEGSVEAAYEEAKEVEHAENMPLEQQFAGFNVPGIHFPTDTGIASTRTGLPGPSSQPGTSRAQAASADLAYAGPPSFAASAAGVQPSAVRPHVARNNTAGGPQKGHRDDWVYSFQSDRFVPASAHAGQAQMAEVAALKNTAGVDIFAIPPADHIQRLPEQLAHTLKYMVTQLDQITRALHVFEYRMNLHEQKVDRLQQQQERWNKQDGY